MNKILLVNAKKGKQDRKSQLNINKKGQAIIKFGTIQLLVEVKKNGSLWELWAYNEDGTKHRKYNQGLDARMAWDYCLGLYSIDLVNVK